MSNDMVEKLVYCGCDEVLAKQIHDLCVKFYADDEAIKRIVQCCASGRVCIEDFRSIAESAPGVFKNPSTVRQHIYEKGILSWDKLVSKYLNLERCNE